LRRAWKKFWPLADLVSILTPAIQAAPEVKNSARANELYDKPESESPSVRGSEQLELWLRSFDWAGTDGPQLMKVSCSASSKEVVAITLAASSL
jgi:hypothetical protein